MSFNEEKNGDPLVIEEEDGAAAADRDGSEAREIGRVDSLEEANSALRTENSMDGDPSTRTLKRPRFRWTPEVHKQFVDAVAHLGINNAVPKMILQLMNVEGLTRENVANHLHMYRCYLESAQRLSNESPSALPPRLFASTVSSAVTVASASVVTVDSASASASDSDSDSDSDSAVTVASASDSDSAPAPACPDDDEGGEYEVFLSFRNEDTRKGFTDFLYTYLKDAGIRTFRGNNKLPVGEEIDPELVKAIKESKISIPIFSKNYASSKWCLNELLQMVECQTHMGQKIFPIFYDVEPFEVRKQIGNYEEAFRIPDMNVDIEIVQGWKKALKIVGKLEGLELKKETNGHEGELVKKVVEKVLIELKKDYTVVPDNLVGIDHHIEELMGMLNVNSNDVRIVGVHGMGGIGKTTIAKVIFNQLCGRFESCCFLEDVRETSKQHKGLVNLQIQLISKILKTKCPNIVDVDEGVNTIKDKVCRKRVFIVLDDVDDKSQFDKLAGKRDWLCPGSRIIVTTRNKEVLDLLKVCSSYEPPLMNPSHSLILFSKYAFLRDHPPQGYDILSNRAVETAAGVPLALQDIGSLLFGKDKFEWEDILRKREEKEEV